MFERCTALNSDITNWNVSNIGTMVRMFAYASNFDQNIGGWDVSNVESFSSMFFRAFSFNQNISTWNLSSAESLFRMFGEATSFNQDISIWETGSVKDMEYMFEGAIAFNQDISTWDVSSVEIMTGMFSGATAFDQNLGQWDLSSMDNMEEMFSNVTLSTDNYDAILIGWSTDTSGVVDDGIDDIPHDITFDGGLSTYCAGSDARFLLDRPQIEGGYNWTITDGNIAPGCGVVMEINLFLEGASLDPTPGEEHLMRDSLRSEGLLPITSPYPDGISVDPLAFDITGPNAIVDWVWIELRDADDPSIVNIGFSALLQRDGDIISAEGIPFVTIGFLEGDYYVAVNHRNHVGVMTNTALTFESLNPTIIDLSSDTNSVIGGLNAVTQLPNGKYGIYTGDYDENGQIQNSDAASIIQLLGTAGYSNADLDLNGQIQNTDVNSLLYPNFGKGQQY